MENNLNLYYIFYAVAKAKNVLGEFPVSASLQVSANIVKNAKSVTVPNTGGLKGIKAAFCAGLVGDGEAELQALSKVSKAEIAKRQAKIKKPMNVVKNFLFISYICYNFSFCRSVSS